VKQLNRRQFLKWSAAAFGAAAFGAAASGILGACSGTRKRPNILLAISDDQCWRHTGFAGSAMVQTPAFDRVAAEGVYFENAFCAAPQCSPCRAALLTGRHIWQLREAGTHASNFPRDLMVFTDLLENAGYQRGYTGKPWGPGNWQVTRWPGNPVGPGFDEISFETAPAPGISNNDYSANFEAFLEQRDPSRPFFFWYGGREPHRAYDPGAGERAGKHPAEAEVPPFLPDAEIVRADLLDYAVEIEWFDRHLGQMLHHLEEAGELENTLVLVTSDNGMPFPRAKANLYEYGVHMPLAIQWPRAVKSGRRVSDLISFIDLAPTLLEAAGLGKPPAMTGRSFYDLLISRESGRIDPSRDEVLFGRERHTHARPDNLGYPSRALRSDAYLYIRNFKPERWPAGDPTGSGDPEGFHDVDGSPTKSFMLENSDRPEVAPLFELAFAKRPAEELYDIVADPGCLRNLASRPEHSERLAAMRSRLEDKLRQQGDPRLHGRGDLFESYPRYSRMRDFPGFKEQGEYNPAYSDSQ